MTVNRRLLEPSKTKELLRTRQSSTDRSARRQRTLSVPTPEIRRTFGGRVHYFWSLFAAGALLLIAPPPVLVTWLLNRRQWFYPWTMFGARNWLRLSGVQVRVRGREHLDPNRTYIFAANHRSYLDTAALHAHAGRRVGILAKKELLKVPILGYWMGFVNIMAIDRSSREEASTTLHAALEKIRRGLSFVVFVEGKRAAPGELLPFKKGAFLMALEAGVPIIPVAIKNTDTLMARGTGVARSGTMEIVFLPPVETDGVSTGEELDELVNTVRARIAAELGLATETQRHGEEKV